MSTPMDTALNQLTTYVQQHSAQLFRKQHRDPKQKRKFSLKGSFKAGLGSSQVGNLQHIGKKPHFRKHNFKNTAVYTEPVMNQTGLNEWQKTAYRLAASVIELLDPEFAAGEYLVNFSHMNSADHYVKKHVDKDDIRTSTCSVSETTRAM